MGDTLKRWTQFSRRTTLKGIGSLAVGTAASGVASANQSEATENSFTAHLLPSNAVPPEYTPASCDAEGIANFHFDENEKTLTYKFQLNGIEGVTGVHLHKGSPGENGPHVANLYKGKQTGYTGEFFSLYAQGEITSDDFADAFDGSFADMIALIRNENTYLQVHRGRKGKEVIRGALR